MNISGDASTSYGFTGEWKDVTGMVFLRARYYTPGTGRFITKDIWPGDYTRPLTLNGWNYVESNPVNFTDPSGLYAKADHYRLTLLWAQREAMKRCPRCLVGSGYGLSHWVAAGNRHMDSQSLDAVFSGHGEFHFKAHDQAWSDVRRMIAVGDPYLVGAALHGLQDYWSHTYEGYTAKFPGHGKDSALAGCIWWSGAQSPCQRPPNAELAILLSLWSSGEIASPTREALKSQLSSLGAGIEDLSTSNLFDIWLREQEGPPDTRKAAYWKNLYGYDTDAYYAFTRRDRLMERDSKAALAEYFDELGTFGLCVFDYWLYVPPDDAEIIRQLSGGTE
jgi:RHS repeat-associated protein